MSQQAPIIVVSTADRPSFACALNEANLFPVINAEWTEASRAVAQLTPSAVLVASVSGAVESHFKKLAKQIATTTPYLPLIVVDPGTFLPDNAIPFSQIGDNIDRLISRLRAALRVRTLHSTVLRRLDGNQAAQTALAEANPTRDATVLLIGRGAGYPALSVSFGERMRIVGALSIEAAAKHLNTRDIDGIVLGEGFTQRVKDAFLTVLAEEARFRNLPIIVTPDGLVPAYDLPNLEIMSGEPALIAINALPLIRQQAFEAHLGRALRSIDSCGLLDPMTGLLTRAAFNRNIVTAVDQSQTQGGGLSVARFAFHQADTHAQLDGARILSRSIRQMDFATLQKDRSIIAVFTETDLRGAHVIARRLSSVMHHGKRGTRSESVVTCATLLPSDSAKSLLARLYDQTRCAAS